jgi:DNA-binding NtrC family response regulator
MRLPQIIIMENDGTIAVQLKPLATDHRWLLREPRQAPACLEMLRTARPAVLVSRLGRHLLRELTLLDQVCTEAPDVPVLVVLDTDDLVLMSIVFELGATYVLMPPASRKILPSLVESMLLAQIRRSQQELRSILPPTPTPAGESDDAD